MHRSTNEVAAASSAEMAGRTRPRCSTVKLLDVRPVRPSKDARLISERHYLHSMPTAPTATFGVYLDGELVGAVVVTAGARNADRLLEGSPSGSVLTLARLWMEDRVPRNAESRVIAVVTRLLTRSHDVKALVSYADPEAGHRGRLSGSRLDVPRPDKSRALPAGPGRQTAPPQIGCHQTGNELPLAASCTWHRIADCHSSAEAQVLHGP